MFHDGTTSLAVANTPVPLIVMDAAHPGGYPARTIYVQPKSTNVGPVYIGGPTVGNAAGTPTGAIFRVGDTGVTFPAGAMFAYNMSHCWMNADNVGDGVTWLYVD